MHLFLANIDAMGVLYLFLAKINLGVGAPRTLKLPLIVGILFRFYKQKRCINIETVRLFAGLNYVFFFESQHFGQGIVELLHYNRVKSHKEIGCYI